MRLLKELRLFTGSETLTELNSQSKLDPNTIHIEVAYATPDKQVIVKVQINNTVLPREAIRLSGIVEEFPEIQIDSVNIGIFGKKIADNYQLQEKDRIEIYRPLLADPKEVRRRLAAEGKTMGNKKVAS